MATNHVHINWRATNPRTGGRPAQELAGDLLGDWRSVLGLGFNRVVALGLVLWGLALWGLGSSVPSYPHRSRVRDSKDHFEDYSRSF